MLPFPTNGGKLCRGLLALLLFGLTLGAGLLSGGQFADAAPVMYLGALPRTEGASRYAVPAPHIPAITAAGAIA